jgi:WD40 repeat protein
VKESTWVGRPSDTPTVDAASPWPGLAAFREADQAFFKGREAVIEEVVRIVTRAPVTVLFGVSGLGKTSLLRAGIFPGLRLNGILPIYVRLRHGDDTGPLRRQVWDALAAAVEATNIEAPEPDEDGTLWEYFHRRDARFWNERNRLVTPLLVFDQFEEIFTVGRASVGRRQQAEAFLGELADLAEARPPAAVKERLESDPELALRFTLVDRPCKLLLSLREDFLADLSDLTARMPSVHDNTFRLQRMNAGEALRVVQVEGLMDAEVAERVVAFVAAPDHDEAAHGHLGAIEPALLSVFCRELNLKRQAQGRSTITADLVEGSATRIIADFYHRAMAEPGLGTGVRRLIEEKLLTRSGFRNVIAEEEALVEPGVSAADLDRLIALRLLRREDTGRKGQARIELTHDVLTEPIRISRDERHIREQEERKLAVLRDFELQERTRSDEAHRRKQRLLWATVLTVVACGALSLALFAMSEKGKADRALSTADVDRVLLGDPEPLPYLARAVINNPADDLPRAVLFAQLAGSLPVIATLEQKAPIANAFFAAGGSRVVTVSRSGDARLWSFSAGVPGAHAVESCCAPFATSIARAAVSQNGSRIVTAGMDGSVMAWEVGEHPTPTQGLPPFSAVGGVVDLQVSADGALAAIVTYDGLVRVWTTGSDVRVVSFSAADTGAAARAASSQAGRNDGKVQFNGDGTRLLTVIDARARIWDTTTGKAVASPLDDVGDVADASFSRDGARLLAVLASRGVRVWNGDGSEVKSRDPALAQERARQAVFAPSGSVIATLAFGRRVRLWDVASGTQRGVTMAHERPVFAWAFSPDGSRLLTASEDQTTRLWDADTGEPVALPMRHHAPVGTAAFSSDGTLIVTASADQIVQVWDVRRALRAATPVPHPDRVLTIGFSPDGTALLTTAKDGVARVWDAATGSLRTELKGETPIDYAVYSRDGTRIATKGGRVAQLWAADEGQPVPGAVPMRLEGQGTAPLWFVATGFTPSGGHVVTVASDGTRTLWDAGSGARASSFPGTGGIVSKAAFSPTGRTLATAAGAKVSVWETESGRPLATIEHTSGVNGIQFSRDGAFLLTASQDGSARLWNVATRAEPVLLRHDEDVSRAVFNESGSEVISTSASGSVRVWDVRGAFDEKRTQPRTSALNIESKLTIAEPSHGRVFTGGEDGAVRTWSARSRVLIGPPFRHPGPIKTLTVSRDGSRIATVAEASGFSEPMARIWDVPVGDAQDASTLREIAEAVAGHRLVGDGVLTDLPPAARPVAAPPDGWRPGDRLAEKFVRWFLADPATRPVSPLSSLTPEQYVSRLRATGSEAARAEAQRTFGWRPTPPAAAATTQGQ